MTVDPFSFGLPGDPTENMLGKYSATESHPQQEPIVQCPEPREVIVQLERKASEGQHPMH